MRDLGQPPDLDAEPAVLQSLLCAWFRRDSRSLPWRRRRTLYGTWVAEIMLQQTTVSAVVPYWERFLARFPDVTALAAAAEEEVLALWSGLGYYRRARALHEAARRIVTEDGGRLPADREGWSRLPGIGPYASGAIASLGAGEAVPAVDANVRRVLTRWAAASPEAAEILRGKRLDGLAASLVPAGEPGVWNEALMELGALVCTARAPRCGSCPVGEHCRAGRAGLAAEIPPPSRRATPTPVRVGALVARLGERILLVPPGGAGAVRLVGRRRPLRDDLAGLHRGLWGPPTTPWYAAAGRGFAAAAARTWSRWLAAAGFPGAVPAEAGMVRHAITRWRLEVLVHAVRVPDRASGPLVDSSGSEWSAPQGERPLSRLAEKILARPEPKS